MNPSVTRIMCHAHRLSAVALVAAAMLGTTGATAAMSDGELDVPYVQTPDDVVNTMLDLANIRPGETVIDLGSGDGRLLIEAARRGGHGFGVDIDPRLVELANENARRAGLADRAEFRVQDLFDTDLGPADVITVYLLPAVNEKLLPTLLELEPGTRIVSHDYGFGSWPPDRKITVEAPDKPVNALKVSDLLLFVVPASVEGRWRGSNELGEWTFTLEQSFQQVEGTVRPSYQQPMPIEGQLSGRQLHLQAGRGVAGVEFSGEVSGDRIEGHVRDRGREAALSLRRLSD